MDDHSTGAGRPRRPEPSWPTVIATTVRLWLERHNPVRVWLIRGRRVLVVAVVGLLVAVVTVTLIDRAPAPPPAARQAASDSQDAPAAPQARQAAPALLAASATRDQAAAWVAAQVAVDAIVACDPAMCDALQAKGVPASRLLSLGAAAADPLGSDVLVATPAVRSEFGARLASVYAPLVIASFGSGAGRIDIRAVAPDGAAAYDASVSADWRARISAGRQLLRNRHISVSAAARAVLDAGRVDPRLLLTLAALAAVQRLRIVAFGDPSPGASAAVPFRGADIAIGGRAGQAARLRSLLSFVDAQHSPFTPARAGIGNSVLSVEYAAPSPLGLLSGP